MITPFMLSLRLPGIFISTKFLCLFHQFYLSLIQIILNSNVANIEDSSSNEESPISKTKKLFWVTRYSLGKTLSKELFIEHEFADDETRHRLIELHTSTQNQKKHHLLLATIALILNPPIGLMACIFVYMAKRQSKYMLMNYENIVYERVAARYAFISYILSIISIGLTVSIITTILLYFFVRDLKFVNRNSLNMNRYEEIPSSENTNTVDYQQQEQDSTSFEDVEIE